MLRLGKGRAEFVLRRNVACRARIIVGALNINLT